MGASPIKLRLVLLLFAIWMAALWAACVLVPAVAFSALPDPSLAGRVAGRAFFVAAVTGGICAVLVLGLLFRQEQRLWQGLTVTCAVLPIASELFVGPAMRAARLVGDSEAVRFYHGVGSVLFLSAAVLSVVLFWHHTRSVATQPAG